MSPVTRTKPPKDTDWARVTSPWESWEKDAREPSDNVRYTLRGLTTIAGDAILQLTDNAQILAGSPSAFTWRLNASGLTWRNQTEDDTALSFLYNTTTIMALRAYWTDGDDAGATAITTYPASVTGYQDMQVAVTTTGTTVYNTNINLRADATGADASVLFNIKDNNTATTAPFTFNHNAASAAAGIGVDLNLKASSDTTNNLALARISATRPVATHATRTGRLQFFVEDYGAEREALRMEANGTALTLGFFGSTGTTKPTVTGSRAGNAALASLLSALANMGLVTDSSTA